MNSNKPMTHYSNEKLSPQHSQNSHETRTCFNCYASIHMEEYISWELIEFCSVNCISGYFKSLKSSCTTCLSDIQETDIGKFHLKLEKSFALFCSFICLKKYEASIKICTYCEKRQSSPKMLTWSSVQTLLNKISKEMSFCSKDCFKNFLRITKMSPPEIPRGTICCVCNVGDSITIATNYNENTQYFCGLRCSVAFNFVRSQMGATKCDMCENYFSINLSTFIAHEGSTTYSFCSKSCKNIYMISKAELMVCNWCYRKKSQFGMIRKYFKCVLEFFCCCLNCFVKYRDFKVTGTQQSVEIKQHGSDVIRTRAISILKANKITEQRNVATMCSVKKSDKSITCHKTHSSKSTQTDLLFTKILLPIPIPFYIPIPFAMFNVPVPTVLPMPLSIPVPVFLPSSQVTLNKIIEKFHDLKNAANNPCENDILKIAEIIAENLSEKKNDNTREEFEAPYVHDTSTEVYENIDVEHELSCEIMRYREKDEPQPKIQKCVFSEFNETQNCNGESSGNVCEMKNSLAPFKMEMRLDHTLGINAWKQWASKKLNVHKNLKFIKSEILQMTPEELSFALSLFVKELRKPNGDQYAPDTLFYLCLGIQYYLDVNGRSDSIFFDMVYKYFIECLDVFAQKFCSLYDDESHFIITRVEEEHLWETKQLGCWSPYALLNTLVYFNTKYYCRSNVDEHMELSFFHIMKAYKKSKLDNYFILRLYPRSTKSDGKQVYEQYQNKDDPLRCPVKLYEFYLSKCPENVKNSQAMLYLMPEKYVISDSPLWFSSAPLPKEFLQYLINRVKMIKEINVALLSR